MPFYLESQDGSQSYRADLFCNKIDLADGQLYALEDLGFSDWLKTAASQHKPPQRKLVAKWSGPRSDQSKGEL